MSDEFYVITTTKGKPKLIENYSDKKHADAAMEQLKKHDKRLSYSVVDVKELQKMKLDPNKDSDWAEITEGRAPSKSDMKSIVPDALDAFWAVIAKHYKKFGITTGDLDVTTEMRFSKAAEDAVTVWVEGNYVSESTDTKTKKTAVNESIKSFEQFIELSKELTAGN